MVDGTEERVRHLLRLLIRAGEKVVQAVRAVDDDAGFRLHTNGAGHRIVACHGHLLIGTDALCRQLLSRIPSPRRGGNLQVGEGSAIVVGQIPIASQRICDRIQHVHRAHVLLELQGLCAVLLHRIRKVHEVIGLCGGVKKLVGTPLRVKREAVL